MKPSILFGWIYFLIMIAEYASLISYANGFIGMNWGRMASQRIVPSMVVDMLLQNGIHEIKVFSTSENVLDAFVEADIGITVTVPNERLESLDTVDACKIWIQTNLASHVRRGVNVRYVTVGAQPYSTIYFNKTFYNALPVLKNMQEALKDTDFGGKVVKATMNTFTDIMNNEIKPSESEFRPDIKQRMIETCQLLMNDNAPIFLDMFPLYNTLNFTNDIEFAFFDNNSTAKFMDGEMLYSNIFEVLYDKFICTLEKNGLSGLKVIGGQLGWPTDGIQGANRINAKRFHNGVVEYFVSSGKGTPRHPAPIDVYIHNFIDENRLAYNNNTRYIRHWGIYEFDGQPKFSIDFSGQGRDIKPVPAKGITHMPKRWCVFNNNTKNTNETNKVAELAEEACGKSDCTSMSTEGGSCWNLPFTSKVSYSFNMFFQIKSQRLSDEACNFEGFGVIVPDDPSTETCIFPVGIIAAENNQVDLLSMGSRMSELMFFTNFMMFIFLWILLLM